MSDNSGELMETSTDDRDVRRFKLIDELINDLHKNIKRHAKIENLLHEAVEYMKNIDDDTARRIVHEANEAMFES